MSAARDMTVVLRLRADGTAEVVGAVKAVAAAIAGTGTVAAAAGAQISQASSTAAQAQRDAAAAAESEAAAIARFRQMIDPTAAVLRAITAETECYSTWAAQARISDAERVAGLSTLAARMGLSAEAAGRMTLATAGLDAQVASGSLTVSERINAVEKLWKAETQAAQAAASSAAAASPAAGPSKSDSNAKDREEKAIADLKRETEDYTKAMRGSREEREKNLLKLEAQTKVNKKVMTVNEAAAWVEGKLAKKKSDVAAAAGDAATAAGVETRAAQQTAKAYLQSEAAGLAYATIGEKLAEAHKSQYGAAWALSQAQESLSQRYAKATGAGAAYIASLDRQLVQERARAAAAGQGGAAEQQATNAITAQAQVRERLLTLNAEQIVLDKRHAEGQVSDLSYQAQSLAFEQQRQGIEVDREAILTRLNAITATQTLKTLNQQNATLEQSIEALQAEGALLFASQNTREKELALLALKAKYQKDIAAATGGEKVELQDAYDKAVGLTNQYYAGKAGLDAATKSAEALKKAGKGVEQAFAEFLVNVQTEGENAFEALGGSIVSIFKQLQTDLIKNQLSAVVNVLFNTSTTSSGSTTTASGGDAGDSASMTTLTQGTGSSFSFSNLFGGTGSSSLMTTSNLTSFAKSGIGETLGLSRSFTAIDDAGVEMASSMLTPEGTNFVEGMSAAGIGTSLAGMAGSIAGSFISSELFGDSYETSLGSSLGGTTGAMAGAAIGSAFPVIGTALGALIGGLFGSVSGGGLGSLFGDEEIPKGGAGFYVQESGLIGTSGTYALDGVEEADMISLADDFNSAFNSILDALDSELLAAVSDVPFALSVDAEGYYSSITKDGVESKTSFESVEEAAIDLITRLLGSGYVEGGIPEEVQTALDTIQTTDVAYFTELIVLAASWQDLLDGLNGTIDYQSSIMSGVQDTLDGYLDELQSLQDMASDAGLSVDDLNAAYEQSLLTLVGLGDGGEEAMSDLETQFWTTIYGIQESGQLFEQIGYSYMKTIDTVKDALLNAYVEFTTEFYDTINATLNSLTGKDYLNSFDDYITAYEDDLEYAKLIGADTTTLGSLWAAMIEDVLSGAENAAIAAQDLSAAFPDYAVAIWAAYDAVTATSTALAKSAMQTSINGLASDTTTTPQDILTNAGLTSAGLGGVADTITRVFNALSGGADDIGLLSITVEDLFLHAVDTGLATTDQVDSIISDLITVSADYWDRMQQLTDSNVDLLTRAYDGLGMTLDSALLSFDYQAAVDRADTAALGGDLAVFDAVTAVDRTNTALSTLSGIITDQIDVAQSQIDETATLVSAMADVSNTIAALKLDDALSPSTAYGLLIEAQAQYAAAYTRATDASLPAEERATAIGEVQTLVATYLTYAHEFYGSTEAYAELYAARMADLEALTGDELAQMQSDSDLLQAQIDELQGLADAIDAGTATTALSFDELQAAVTEHLAGLSDQVATLSTVLASSGLAGSVTAAIGATTTPTTSAAAVLDWDQYLAANPDVAVAVAAGQITAAEHYLEYGQYEGRTVETAAGTALTGSFDAAGYLAANPDVAAAVAAGQTTAYDHFVTWGAAEGRAAFDTTGRAYAAGGVVGSDAGGLITNGLYGVDSVVAMTSDGAALFAGGEYIMPTAQTAQYLPILESMRAGTWSAYASSGRVVANDARPVNYSHHWGTAPAVSNDPWPAGVSGLHESRERQAVAIERQNAVLEDIRSILVGSADEASGQRSEANELLARLGDGDLLRTAAPRRRRKSA